MSTLSQRLQGKNVEVRGSAYILDTNTSNHVSIQRAYEKVIYELSSEDCTAVRGLLHDLQRGFITYDQAKKQLPVKVMRALAEL